MLKISFSQIFFKYTINWNNIQLSEFDIALENIWKEKMKEGIFRYELKNLKSRILEGNFQFLAQLNTDRAIKRRKPMRMIAINQPFDENLFNFTKINKNEIVFQIIREFLQEPEAEDFIAINVSPLEFGHCLLLPSLHQRLPQLLTLRSIKLATEVILSSYNPALRIAFNGLCAYASVNHLHLHIYYLNQPMLLETIAVNHLSGNCYTLEKHPSKGYVFQISSVNDIIPIILDVDRLISLLIENNVAHNLYMTRGLSFERAASSQNITERDNVRIYVWARTHSEEIKIVDELNPAACELFGHLLLKTEESYYRFTEEEAIETLRSLTEGPFHATKEKVKQLFENIN
ncbi:hypothetical protein O3M35_011323 [Rhynocoris fuscipes]|uniref:GDP-D-glucose phosphorylase 1 n=1 Tax=Rhynocoris fuscipes TaxID=488301 RepID=A0AAW1CUP4_9HEMI